MSYASFNLDHAGTPLWERRDIATGASASADPLAIARDRLRSRLLFVLLCGVVFVAMFNGLVKQAFNWSQAVYVVLDVPWVLFLLVWAVWPRPTGRRVSTGGVGALLVIILAYSVVQAFNPLLPSPF